MADNDNQISKYDRLRGNLKDVGMFTKPSTIQTVQQLTGAAETFIITTCRTEDLGDYIFIEYVDETQHVTRLALPPKVANIIASQRDALTSKRRSQAGKRRAANMTEGEKEVLRQRLAKARKKRKKA